MLKVNQRETGIKKCQISPLSDFLEHTERPHDTVAGKVLKFYLH